METQLVPYDLNMQVIEDLRKKYLDVTIPEGDKVAYEMVMGGLRQCREIRLACDEWVKERKADIIKAGKHYDAEKKRVHGLIAPIEGYLKTIRQQEDDRIENERQAEIAKEKARVAKIEQAIEDINRLGMSLSVGLKSDQLQALLDEAMAHDIDEKAFEEFIDTARRTQENVIAAISQALTAQKQVEEEDRLRKEEAEALAKQKAEQEAKETALAEEKRKIDEEKRQARLQIELARTTRLKAIGLTFEGEFFLRPTSIDLPDTVGIIEKGHDLFQMTDEEFEAFIEETAPKIEDIIKQEGQYEKERQEKEIAERQQVEEEAKAREEALKPDRERILGYLDNISEIPIPGELSTEQMQRQMDFIQEELSNLIEKWRERL